MTDRLFFYGTLMRGLDRPQPAQLNRQLRQVGRGWIGAALFDLGPYPAAVPTSGSRVWGEVHRMLDCEAVLSCSGMGVLLQRTPGGRAAD